MEAAYKKERPKHHFKMTSEDIHGRNHVQSILKKMNEKGKFETPVKQYRKYRKEVVDEYEKQETEESDL